MKSKRRKIIEIGWREYVGLPELHIDHVKAKIDSGARTSALHAEEITPFDQDGIGYVSFLIPFIGCEKGIRCSAKIVDRRPIKNTGGVAEERYIVKTTLTLGEMRWPVEVSLTSRQSMRFPVIIGRTAIRERGFLLNAGRSYLSGRPGYISPRQE
ncbi:RimK/LysX family protein [uncultured Kiloniella sp.]|uniref:ATP-dependent zinc protease family protein n=1 Tax=uncultured Kiloniella sp. TaxID=1133091 RepID=UPI0026206587|nr:RimK/LysX family protein [uncultured Kiloniella sp.]